MKDKPNKYMTLSFILNKKQILLAMKKTGFGKGRWNGYGGKVKSDEEIESAAKRETLEEIGIKVEELEKRAIIDFNLPKEEKMLQVHLFEITKHSGEPKETKEMKPKWFEIDKIPYKDMWDDDSYWLPVFLEGKLFRAYFEFDENDKVTNYEINEVEKL